MGTTRYPVKLGTFLIFGCLLAIPSLGKEVEEKFDDGTIHIRYKTDGRDRKIGDYEELFNGGKVKVARTYTADKKNGTWSTFSEEGKPLEARITATACWRDLISGIFPPATRR